MSNSITNPPPAPSPRDLEIYKRSVVLGHNQCAIAMDYNLKQPRISRIIAKVRRWLAAGGAPSDPTIHDHLAQQHLSKATQKLRLLRVIERATYAMEFQQPSQVTTRSRYHGHTEVWREETRRQSPEINMPAMRLVLRAVKGLEDLEASHDQVPADPKVAKLSEADLLQSVFDLLCRWRIHAETAGRLVPSTDIPQFIAQGLSALIGTHIDSTGRLTGNIPANIPSPPELSLVRTTDPPSPSNT